jgi:hypothetical protein
MLAQRPWSNARTILVYIVRANDLPQDRDDEKSICGYVHGMISSPRTLWPVELHPCLVDTNSERSHLDLKSSMEVCLQAAWIWLVCWLKRWSSLDNGTTG